MAECGAQYEHLLQASGGRTFADPFKGGIAGPVEWCNEPDAEAWYAQARHVFGLVRSAWNELIAIENERKSWPWTEKWRPLVTAYETAHGFLPEPSAWMAFGAADCAKSVELYQANIRMGACVLQRLNEGLVAYGKGEIDPGHTPKVGFPWWGWALGGAAVVVTVGAVWSIHRQRQRQAPLAFVAPMPAPAPLPEAP